MSPIISPWPAYQKSFHCISSWILFWWLASSIPSALVSLGLRSSLCYDPWSFYIVHRVVLSISYHGTSSLNRCRDLHWIPYLHLPRRSSLVSGWSLYMSYLTLKVSLSSNKHSQLFLKASLSSPLSSSFSFLFYHPLHHRISYLQSLPRPPPNPALSTQRLQILKVPQTLRRKSL